MWHARRKFVRTRERIAHPRGTSCGRNTAKILFLSPSPSFLPLVHSYQFNPQTIQDMRISSTLLLAAALQVVLLFRSTSIAASSSMGEIRCSCVGSLASWDFSLEQAVTLADVVLMGKVVELSRGLRGTMNATVSILYAYKENSQVGRQKSLSEVRGITNFGEGADEDRISLFFLMVEPTGNLALQCMMPLVPSTNGNEGTNLVSLLNFVYAAGKSKSL